MTVAGAKVASIGRGLLILLGVGHGDTVDEALFLAEKVANLRIFEDQQGKTNLSRLGRAAARPSSSRNSRCTPTRRRAADHPSRMPEIRALAEPLVMQFAEALREHGVPTQTGSFGQHMQVEIHNDGPVTIWLEREPARNASCRTLT